MNQDSEPRVTDNTEESRYELHLGDRVAGTIAYMTKPGVVVLIHTEVDPAYEGRGFGSRLVAGALDDIRERGLSLVPLCPFVSSYLRRHPEYRDLVTRDRASRR